MFVCFFLYLYTKFRAHISFSLSFSSSLANKHISDAFVRFACFACLTATEYNFSLWTSSLCHQNIHILIIVPKEKSFNHFSFSRSLLSLEPAMVACSHFRLRYCVASFAQNDFFLTTMPFPHCNFCCLHL